MKNIVVVFLIIINVLKTGYGQRSQCGPEKFQCKNGECIQGILLCDGQADCRDKSDETTAECSKPYIVCPHTAFRCAYGACVDGDATCNGVKDCIDNSDETLLKCSMIFNTTSQCRQNEFKCKNGQCIASNNLCDGAADCSDGSDETFFQCGGTPCEQLFFRCGYGACIDGDLKCNGAIDCVDGSDEYPTTCQATATTTTQRPPPVVKPTTTTTTTYRPSSYCIAPPQPQNGAWRTQLQCYSGMDCQNEQFPPGAQLVYSCNSGFRIIGNPNVYCNLGGKWSSIPVCEELRCKDLNSASISAHCRHPGSDYITCSLARPNTIADLKCRNSYRVDGTLPLAKTVICNNTGQWSPEPLRCVAVCGIIPTPTTPLIVNGTLANITEFPWHATLYKAVTPNAKKEFICGGTIIQERLLVTAAHCVTENVRGTTDKASKYFIVTGNIFQDYDSLYHDRDMVVKKAVKNIYVSCDYSGISGSYTADIAILEIFEPFVFTALLQPICLDHSNDVILDAGVVGRVAGFGRTALGPSSFVLQTITVPFISRLKCREATTIHGSENSITYDKFCAGYTNGSSVCDGDSGGGLVFKWNSLWYLKGIVSVSVGTKVVGGAGQCDSSTYALYTCVTRHMSWVERFILGVESKGELPTCGN